MYLVRVTIDITVIQACYVNG